MKECYGISKCQEFPFLQTQWRSCRLQMFFKMKDWRPATLLKRDLNTVKIGKFLRTAFITPPLVAFANGGQKKEKKKIELNKTYPLKLLLWSILHGIYLISFSVFSFFLLNSKYNYKILNKNSNLNNKYYWIVNYKLYKLRNFLNKGWDCWRASKSCKYIPYDESWKKSLLKVYELIVYTYEE